MGRLPAPVAESPAAAHGKGAPTKGSGPERVKMRTSVDPSSSPPLSTVPPATAASSPATRPCPPTLPASHHRSSSRLSFCRLPDCTPWAPRPPPPPGSSSCCCRRRPGSAGREKGCGLSGGGRLAGLDGPEGGEERAPEGLGTAGRRGRERGAGEVAAPTRDTGEGKGANHLRRRRGDGNSPLWLPRGREGHD